MKEHLLQKHLSEEKILAFSEHKLTGIDYVDVLEHIEVCEECRKKITAPTKAEIIEQILSDDSMDKSDDENHQKPQNETQPVQRNWFQKIKYFLFKKS